MHLHSTYVLCITTAHRAGKTKQMKANELRINNLVYGVDEDFNRSPVKIGVGDLCDMECSRDNEDDYEPIPLTSEWLEKLGALKDEYGDVFIEVDSDSDIRLYLSTMFN